MRIVCLIAVAVFGCGTPNESVATSHHQSGSEDAVRPHESPEAPSERLRPVPSEAVPNGRVPAEPPTAEASPSGWAHNPLRWRVAQQTLSGPENTQRYSDRRHGLLIAISNHETLVICPNKVIVEVVGGEDYMDVSVQGVTNLGEMLDGVPLLDVHDSDTFVCHPEWPTCTQGNRLYVFANDHLTRVDQDLEYDVASYPVEEREFILEEIERRMQPDRQTCRRALAALRAH